jgi:hypothetical protein
MLEVDVLFYAVKMAQSFWAVKVLAPSHNPFATITTGAKSATEDLQRYRFCVG